MIFTGIIYIYDYLIFILSFIVLFLLKNSNHENDTIKEL